MANKFIYTDGETHTPCRTRKQAIAFLIVQNGGEVRTTRKPYGNRTTYIVARIFEGASGPMLAERRTYRSGESWTLITPELRQAAQDELARSSPRKYYEIDFVYADTHQQFGTGADLTPDEVDKLEAYLQTLVDGGYITEPHVRLPGNPTHQTYAQARKEIANALVSGLSFRQARD